MHSFHFARSTVDEITIITESLATIFISGEFRAVALDMSKGFDKIWHTGLEVEMLFPSEFFN